MRRCPACKSTVRDEDRFCARCGARQPTREEAPDGVTPRWSLELKRLRWVAGAPSSETLLVSTRVGAQDRLGGYALGTGEPLWSLAPEGERAEVLHADRNGFVVVAGERVARYAAASGEEVWASPLPGTSLVVARRRPDVPASLIVTRRGPGEREVRAWTLDVLTGRTREVVDSEVLEALAARVVLTSDAGADGRLRVGVDHWPRPGGAVFLVGLLGARATASSAALFHVDACTREPSLLARAVDGVPLGLDAVHYADTDEGEVLVWAAGGAIIVRPLNTRLDPVRFEVSGLVRLAGVAGRVAYLEVRTGGSGMPCVLAVSLPFGRPLWQSPPDSPCSLLALADESRTAILRRLDQPLLVETRLRDHGFQRSYALPEPFGGERRSRERAEPGPVHALLAGRSLIAWQVRASTCALAAFDRT